MQKICVFRFIDVFKSRCSGFFHLFISNDLPERKIKQIKVEFIYVIEKIYYLLDNNIDFSIFPMLHRCILSALHSRTSYQSLQFLSMGESLYIVARPEKRRSYHICIEPVVRLSYRVVAEAKAQAILAHQTTISIQNERVTE